MSALPLPVPAELAARWHARTVPADGGHLAWVGARGISWHDKALSHWGVGFAIRAGRAPIGPVRPGCDHDGCIQPGHLQDDPERYRERLRLRYIRGLQPVAAYCHRGHNQAVDGRLAPDGDAYCTRCVNSGQDAPRLRLTGEARVQAGLELQARYYDGASLAELIRSTGRTYGYVHDLLALVRTEFRSPGYHREFHAPGSKRVGA